MLFSVGVMLNDFEHIRAIARVSPSLGKQKMIIASFKLTQRICIKCAPITQFNGNGLHPEKISFIFLRRIFLGIIDTHTQHK